MSAARVFVLVLGLESIAGHGRTGRISWALEYRGGDPALGPVRWRYGAGRTASMLRDVRAAVLEARAAGWSVVAGGAR